MTSADITPSNESGKTESQKPNDLSDASSDYSALPYPHIETPNSSDRRGFAKFSANAFTSILIDNPSHPNRKEIEKQIAEEKRIAECSDKELRSHELYMANPLHSLSRDERLYLIRTLPVDIVRKLFPAI